MGQDEGMDKAEGQAHLQGQVENEIQKKWGEGRRGESDDRFDMLRLIFKWIFNSGVEAFLIVSCLRRLHKKIRFVKWSSEFLFKLVEFGSKWTQERG